MDISLDHKHTVFPLSFQKKGYVTVGEIRSSLKWETERAKQVLVRVRVWCMVGFMTAQRGCSCHRAFAGAALPRCAQGMLRWLLDQRQSPRCISVG